MSLFERPKLKVRLGPNAIEIVRQHRILGLIIDDRLNWKVYLKDGTSRQETGAILKTLVHKKWGGDQKMLKNVRIHRIIVLRGIDLQNRYKTSTENIRTDTQQGREASIRSFLRSAKPKMHFAKRTSQRSRK
jgi:hypothetical protein